MNPDEETPMNEAAARQLLAEHRHLIADGRRQVEQLALYIEIATHLATYLANREPPPPALVARSCRALRDVNEQSAALHRDRLLEAAVDGDEYAQAALDLLADDRFWTGAA